MKNSALAQLFSSKRILVILAITILVSGAFTGLYIWENTRADYHGPDDQIALPSIQYNGKTYVLNTKLRTTLIMGLDTLEHSEDDLGSYRNLKQADFILLLVFNEEDKTVSALQINRDTMAEIDVLGVTGQSIGRIVQQIALSHSYGSGQDDSCRNVSVAVSRLLGHIQIDHYVSVTMNGVGVLNDTVGGVTVEIKGDFSKIDPALIEGQMVTLKGDQALTYVRSRKDVQDQTNLARMERQRQYLNALYDRTSQAISENENLEEDIAAKMREYLVTDYTINELESILDSFTKYEFKGIRTLDGDAIVGETNMEYYLDEDDLTEAKIELFYKLKD